MHRMKEEEPHVKNKKREHSACFARLHLMAMNQPIISVSNKKTAEAWLGHSLCAHKKKF